MAETERRKKEILEERARALATVPAEDETEGQVLEVVQFMLSDEKYGIETTSVREIYPLKDYTPVPCTPAYILGIINVRGEIITVINLKKFFELPERGITELNKVIIVQTATMQMGILADAISGVRLVASATMEPSLPTLTGVRAQFIKGITGDRLVILDVQKITTDKRILVEEQVFVQAGH